jgi:hypothetical protein
VSSDFISTLEAGASAQQHHSQPTLNIKSQEHLLSTPPPPPPTRPLPIFTFQTPGDLSDGSDNGLSRTSPRMHNASAAPSGFLVLTPHAVSHPLPAVYFCNIHAGSPRPPPHDPAFFQPRTCAVFGRQGGGQRGGV